MNATDTDYDRRMAARAEAVSEFKVQLRAALAEVLTAEDVEMVAADAENELGPYRFARIAEERAGRHDSGALLRLVLHDVLGEQKRRSRDGCLWGRWRTVELALKEHIAAW